MKLMSNMYKWVVNIFIILIVSVLLSTVDMYVIVNDSVMTTLYTVSGIMFSIGLGLIVSFNLGGVKNPEYIKKIRLSIYKVRNSFVSYFVIITLLFVVDQCSNQLNLDCQYFNFRFFVFIVLLHSILFYIYNFFSIQKLNNDIFDRVNDIR